MISRRDFLFRAAAAPVLLAAGRALPPPLPQQRGMIHDYSPVRDSTNLFAMDQAAALPVRLPPKPDAVPVLDNAQRDELEHHLHCQCGCTLDVFTCRTTDFSCQVSPVMHRDVMELVAGGYSAQEIIDAFVGVYGDRALMAPRKSGFDLLAWFAPGTAVLIAGGVLFALLRRWRGAATASAHVKMLEGALGSEIDATPEELARLQAAIRGDDHE